MTSSVCRRAAAVALTEARQHGRFHSDSRVKETLQDKVAPATHQSHRHPCSAQRRSSAEAAASTARAARRSRRQKVVINSGSAAVTDRRTMNICACLFLRSRRAHVIAAASPRDASPRRNVRQPSRSRSCSRCWLRRHAPRAGRWPHCPQTVRMLLNGFKPVFWLTGRTVHGQWPARSLTD